MTYPLFHPSSEVLPPNSLTLTEFADAFPGEDEHVEFKKSLSKRRVAEAAVAFANHDGGVVLLGVTDQGAVEDWGSKAADEMNIHGLLGEIHHLPRYRIHRCRVGESEIVALAVSPLVEGVAQTSDGRILVRRGASNRPLIGPDLFELMSRRRLTPFESTPTETAVTDADPQLVRSLATAWEWGEEQSEFLERLREKSMATIGPQSRLTVAGALYLVPRPHEALMSKAFVEVFRYRDEGPDEDRREVFSGPVPAQVRDVTAFVLGEIGYDLVMLGLHRREVPRLPEVVLREALANAVAHRSYEMIGASVRVEMRPDRVEVVSPGGLPAPVTLDNIRVQNAARNPAVIDSLRRFGLAEDAGRGVDIMEDTMKQNLLTPPEFKDGSHWFTVVLRLDSSATPLERAWIGGLERDDVAPEDLRLLLAAARGDALSNASARVTLGVDRPEAREALLRLVGKGLLVQTGDRGGTRYRLHPALDPEFRFLEEDIEADVIELAAEGPVTNSRLRAKTGLDRTTALAVLTRMVKKGLIQRVGQKRGTRYILTEAGERWGRTT